MNCTTNISQKAKLRKQKVVAFRGVDSKQERLVCWSKPLKLKKMAMLAKRQEMSSIS